MSEPLSDSTNKPYGLTGESHPEIYERPKRSDPLKQGQLSDEQLESYHKNGFVLVENFFTADDLEPVQKAISVLVDDLVDKLFNAGKISSKYEELGFFKRLTAIEKDFPGANIILHKTGKLLPAFRAIAAHPRMLNLLEDFIGPDISFNPVWNLRTKTPQSVSTTVPWHQDSAYFDNNIYKCQVMTAWIPLLDTNVTNGTLQLVRNAHSEARVAKHTCCAGPTWYVMLEDEDIEKEFKCNLKEDVSTIDVPYGNFILFNNFTPHRSLMNNSDQVRWALDFRWQKTGTPDGLWGLKEPCVVRSSKDPTLKPDWEKFDSVDRNTQQLQSVEMESSYFSTVISGPWMKKWDIVHHNRHTDAFVDDQSQWDPNMVHG